MAVLVVLAAALFNVGLSLIAGGKSFYDERNEELSGAHYMIRFAGNLYRDEYLEYMQQDERIETAEVEEVIMMDNARFEGGGMITINFLSLNQERHIKGFQIVEHIDAPADQAIYVPKYMEGIGYHLGDTMELEFKKQKFSFVIAGYQESTWLSTSVSSISNFYITQEGYDRLYSQIGGGYILSARYKDLNDADSFIEDFKNDTEIKVEAISFNTDILELTIDDMRNASMIVINIMSAVVLGFSLLIVMIVAITIRFRISNHIESQLQNIGTMEAIGYTAFQIQSGIVLEFLLIGAVGAVLGILLSYGMIIVMGGIIADSIGISWNNRFHPEFDLISVLFIMLIVLWTAFVTSSKAARISPLQAFRGGLKAHSFTKNHFPLADSKGGLLFRLSMKAMVFQRKTYLMTGVIYTAIIFAAAFSLILFMNFGTDSSLLLEMTGYEVSDVAAVIVRHKDYDDVAKRLAGMEEVERISLYDDESVELDGKQITCFVSDDFQKLASVQVYQGQFPQYENEIVITGALAKAKGKSIGDSIEIKCNGVTKTYLITGLSQTVSNFGMQCYLSLDGMRRINPSYERKAVQIYLKEGVEPTDFMKHAEQTFEVLSPEFAQEEYPKDSVGAAKKRAEEKLKNLLSMYGADSIRYALMADGEIILSGNTDAYEIEYFQNNRTMFSNNIDSINVATIMMTGIVLSGTMFVIVLVLYMVIKSMIIKRYHELGIYKSIGYTDFQLMLQIALSFLPSAAAGSIVGCLISMFATNHLMSFIMSSMGVMNLQMTINPWVLAVMIVGIILFTFLVSVLCAVRVRKISVYGLLTE